MFRKRHNGKIKDKQTSRNIAAKKNTKTVAPEKATNCGIALGFLLDSTLLINFFTVAQNCIHHVILPKVI